jgi:peptidoglycan/LPS O-acetylase OafA/YrhL
MALHRAMSSHQKPKHIGRMLTLDAMRGGAALFVVTYHALGVAPRTATSGWEAWLPQVTANVVHFAFAGIYLFFVISGFCIHLFWAKARAAGVEKPVIDFFTFWKRRVRRLYPPYFAALAIYLCYSAYKTPVHVTGFYLWDVLVHLFMLHNLDLRTTYTINGAFGTLAIEEQLYLAYFLLLFIRIRWGWGVTLAVCLLARLGWMGFSHLVWLKTGFGIPVPEAAASHWFTWALGAIGVEVMFGLVKLRGWSRDLRLATVLIVAASALSTYLPSISKDTLLHDTSWFLIHPLWGLGFFIVVNRTVLAENSWLRQAKLPSMVSFFSTLGIFSYSIYLTHELVIMQSWRWTNPTWLQLVNVWMVIIPATIIFAWLFFWFCEKPFMTTKPQPQITQITPILQEESA